MDFMPGNYPLTSSGSCACHSYGRFGVLGRICTRLLWAATRRHKGRSCNENIERQLEGGITNTATPVLSPDIQVRLENQEGGASRNLRGTIESAADSSFCNRSKVVPTRTIEGKSYFTVPMNIPYLLFSHRYKIESQDPIDFYVVDQKGLDEFKQGAPFAPYQRGEQVKEFDKYLRLKPGSYFLIFKNSNPATTAVHYEVR